MSNYKPFISYSTKDALEFALKLADDLRKEGFDVWIDKSELRGGTDYDIEIDAALKDSTCVLYLVTKEAIVSKYVQKEVRYAVKKEKLVIPLILHKAELHFLFDSLQHIDFIESYEKGFRELLKALKIYNEAVSITPEPKQVVNSSRKEKRVLKAAGSNSQSKVSLLRTTWVKKLMEIFKKYKDGLGGEFSIMPEIPKERLSIVRQVCSIPKDEEILATSDLTHAGSASHYIAFTQHKFYYNREKENFLLPYSAFPEAEIIKYFNIWHYKHVTINDLKLEYSSSDAADQLTVMLNEIKSITHLKKT